jgi:hypothetical protein
MITTNESNRTQGSREAPYGKAINGDPSATPEVQPSKLYPYVKADVAAAPARHGYPVRDHSSATAEHVHASDARPGQLPQEHPFAQAAQVSPSRVSEPPPPEYRYGNTADVAGDAGIANEHSPATVAHVHAHARPGQLPQEYPLGQAQMSASRVQEGQMGQGQTAPEAVYVDASAARAGQLPQGYPYARAAHIDASPAREGRLPRGYPTAMAAPADPSPARAGRLPQEYPAGAAAQRRLSRGGR